MQLRTTVLPVGVLQSEQSSQTAPSSGTRRYRSPLRAQRAEETRAALIAAATELFATRGWSATGMREVAAAAGVATETLYAHFSSKQGLLRAVTDVAVVGDAQPVALADRPEFIAIGRGRRADRIRAAARLLTAVQERTATMAKLLREAAFHDDDIAGMLRATRERQRLDIGTAAALLVGRALTPSERDGVWAITSPEVYLLLVEESGWTQEQYESWMAATLARQIPRA